MSSAPSVRQSIAVSIGDVVPGRAGGERDRLHEARAFGATLDLRATRAGPLSATIVRTAPAIRVRAGREESSQRISQDGKRSEKLSRISSPTGAASSSRPSRLSKIRRGRRGRRSRPGGVRSRGSSRRQRADGGGAPAGAAPARRSKSEKLSEGRCHEAAAPGFAILVPLRRDLLAVGVEDGEGVRSAQTPSGQFDVDQIGALAAERIEDHQRRRRAARVCRGRAATAPTASASSWRSSFREERRSLGGVAVGLDQAGAGEVVVHLVGEDAQPGLAEALAIGGAESQALGDGRGALSGVRELLGLAVPALELRARAVAAGGVQAQEQLAVVDRQARPASPRRDRGRSPPSPPAGHRSPRRCLAPARATGSPPAEQERRPCRRVLGRSSGGRDGRRPRAPGSGRATPRSAARSVDAWAPYSPGSSTAGERRAVGSDPEAERKRHAERRAHLGAAAQLLGGEAEDSAVRGERRQRLREAEAVGQEEVPSGACRQRARGSACRRGSGGRSIPAPAGWCRTPPRRRRRGTSVPRPPASAGSRRARGGTRSSSR